MNKLICLIFLTAFTAAGFAQSNTVTNADLEKYRQQRLAAERDFRENYREMGFPSPEELAKQKEADAMDLAERSERYKQLQAERARQEEFEEASQTVFYYPRSSGGVYFGAYGYAPRYYYNNQYRNRHRNDRKYRRRGPGYISNPIIRNNWLRQSAPMRRTYRGNFKTKTRVRW